MAVHGMIDIETLGVDPGCVVLTIGGIKFNPYSNAEPHDGLYIRCNVDEQTELGRTVDENTLAWWNKQDPKIKDEALSDNDRVTLNEVTRQINKFCVGLDNIWCQGPTFDFTILENLYRQLGTPVPWHYWQIRDSRTLFKMMPKDPRKEIQSDLHNALADCYYQAKCVQKTFKHFGVVNGR
tara:strand:+ start:43 stop:585 length:543 start_codon:yes stop_codon:yes gene_type:complete